MILTVASTNTEHALVATTKAQNYNLDELVPAVRQSLELIGGLSSIVKPGDKVFVKINHLSPPSPPERGIVTHPVFTEAVIVLLKEKGVEITVGDDIEEGDGDGFLNSGYRAMYERQNVKLVNLRAAGFVEQSELQEILNKANVQVQSVQEMV
jgi:uncharacterized protein (DUF362 family)